METDPNFTDSVKITLILLGGIDKPTYEDVVLKGGDATMCIFENRDIDPDSIEWSSLDVIKEVLRRLDFKS